MKKIITIIFALCFLVLCGCSAYYTVYDHYGVWESENPKMRIIMGINESNVFGDDGILVNEDGSVTPIVYFDLHGHFTIYEYRGEDLRGHYTTELFDGTLRVKNNALILKPEDGKENIYGKEIILRKVSNEIPETESSSEQ